jgi:hypothetical protein
MRPIPPKFAKKAPPAPPAHDEASAAEKSSGVEMHDPDSLASHADMHAQTAGSHLSKIQDMAAAAPEGAAGDALKKVHEEASQHAQTAQDGADEAKDAASKGDAPGAAAGAAKAAVAAKAVEGHAKALGLHHDPGGDDGQEAPEADQAPGASAGTGVPAATKGPSPMASWAQKYAK